ncbi:MAG: hypothetical protein FGM54_11210 [Chitinophagaceae bacterium]|nr:hypothetical protein [Chitinophagaceae bacterium]
MLQKIKDRLFPEPDTTHAVPVYTELHAIKREFVNFKTTYRVGILGYYSGPAEQAVLMDYHRKLESLGYECDIVVFFDKKEHDPQLLLPHFDTTALNKKTGLPDSPKTDSFRVKKFDLLINLFLQPCKELEFIAHHAVARCRVAPHLPHLVAVSDLMVPCQPNDSLQQIIDQINTTLQLKPYVRP